LDDRKKKILSPLESEESIATEDSRRTFFYYGEAVHLSSLRMKV